MLGNYKSLQMFDGINVHYSLLLNVIHVTFCTNLYNAIKRYSPSHSATPNASTRYTIIIHHRTIILYNVIHSGTLLRFVILCKIAQGCTIVRIVVYYSEYVAQLYVIHYTIHESLVQGKSIYYYYAI